MSEASFDLVSEDLYPGQQSWDYQAVWRNEGGCFRVVIRTSNSRIQSRADVSVWGVGGWNFHTSLSPDDWWHDAPSYVKKVLSDDDVQVFYRAERLLLERLAAGLWRSTSISLGRNEPRAA